MVFQEEPSYVVIVVTSPNSVIGSAPSCWCHDNLIKQNADGFQAKVKIYEDVNVLLSFFVFLR